MDFAIVKWLINNAKKIYYFMCRVICINEQENARLNREVERLKVILKSEILRRGECYWLVTYGESAEKGPYCLRCYDVNGITVTLLDRSDEDVGELWVCPECGTNVSKCKSP